MIAIKPKTKNQKHIMTSQIESFSIVQLKKDVIENAIVDLYSKNKSLAKNEMQELVLLSSVKKEFQTSPPTLTTTFSSSSLSSSSSSSLTSSCSSSTLSNNNNNEQEVLLGFDDFQKGKKKTEKSLFLFFSKTNKNEKL